MKKVITVFRVIILIIILVIISFILFSLFKHIDVGNSEKHIDNSSIIYFIENDNVIRAEIRIDNMTAENNPILLYVPFSISQQNVQYNEDRLILGVKQFDNYSILIVYVLEGKNIFLEFINNNRQMYNGIIFDGITSEGVRNFSFKIAKASPNINELENIYLIDNQFINIANTILIREKNNPVIITEISSQTNIKLRDDKGYYIMDYSIDSYVDKKESSTVIDKLFTYVLIPILGSILLSLYPLSQAEINEKRRKSEPIIISIAIVIFLALIILGIFNASDSVGLYIALGLGATEILIYALIRRKMYYEIINEFLNKKVKVNKKENT